MKKDNKKTVWTVGITVFIMSAVFGLVWVASRNIPSNPESKVAVSADVSDHHGGAQSPPEAGAALNDLLDKPVPDFSLSDINGKEYTAKDLQGKKIVMFFNEGLMCYPACWNQIVSLAKDERLNSSDTVVMSVVVDSAKDWQKAIDKMPELGQALTVFDRNASLSGKLGLLTMPSSMHYGSLPGHTYLIIDKDGAVRHTFDDPNMAIHNEQIVAELAKLL